MKETRKISTCKYVELDKPHQYRWNVDLRQPQATINDFTKGYRRSPKRPYLRECATLQVKQQATS